MSTIHPEQRRAPRRKSPTQAEIARAIRAAEAAGLKVMSVVLRPDGYAIETSPSLAPDAEVGVTKPKPVL